jgi:hypothetical protein
MMTYPDRRPASTSVPYSQMTQTGTAVRFVVSRQNEKFLIGQSRKFLLTAVRL